LIEQLMLCHKKAALGKASNLQVEYFSPRRCMAKGGN